MPTSESCDTFESHQHSEWGWFDGGTAAGSRAGSMEDLECKSLSGIYDGMMQQEVEDPMSGTTYFSGDRTRRRLAGGSRQRRSSHSAFSYNIDCGVCRVKNIGVHSCRHESERSSVVLPSCSIWKALRALFLDGAKLHDESHCANPVPGIGTPGDVDRSPDKKTTPDKKSTTTRRRGTSSGTGHGSQGGKRGLVFCEWVDVCYVDCWATDENVAETLWQACSWGRWRGGGGDLAESNNHKMTMFRRVLTILRTW
jgi:hypothetical protein